MKQYILIAMTVFFFRSLTFCSARAPASISELEANYRKGIKDAAKNETVVVSYVLGERKYRLADDRSWEKRWNEIQAKRKARRMARRRAELERRELLATGKYFDDGRGNIRLKEEFRNESLINVEQTEQTEENNQAVFVISGVVKRVIDGDTILLEGHKIRLRGIDAPEKYQPFGGKAAVFLNSLICGKRVRVEYYKYDKYGRIIGTVYLQENDINLAMIRHGFAWHYKQYDDTQLYADAEDEARAAKKGLWMDSIPIPPWDYRKKTNQKGE